MEHRPGLVIIIVICIPAACLALGTTAVSPIILLTFLVGGTADVGIVGTAVVGVGEAAVSALLFVAVAIGPCENVDGAAAAYKGLEGWISRDDV